MLDKVVAMTGGVQEESLGITEPQDSGKTV